MELHIVIVPVGSCFEWRVVAMNNAVLCRSGSDYVRKSDAHRAALRFARVFPKAAIVVFAPG